jgi:2-polyprenyl-3-methyl-5-hydroxy-6-metoxy-1,4-benzoquinol methylase
VESSLSEHADVETSSADYARRFAGPVGEFFLERQARATLELLAPWPGASVLDVGGGHGQLTGPLVDAGYTPTVFGSADACRERVGPWLERGQARFQTGDLLALPYRDGSFDVCLCYRLLPHVARWETLVAELCRTARRAVIVDYPTRRSVNVLADALFGLKKGVEGSTRPFTVFRDAAIEAAFRPHAFRVTGRRPQFFLPMALHRASGSAALARGLEAGAAALGLTAALGSPVILRLERLA